MIISVNDIKAVRNIAINVAPEVFEPYIDDAEKNTVLPAIGVERYFDVEKNKEDERYRVLLYGGTFGEDSCVKYCRGLIYAIAYLAYARFLIDGDIQVTAMGIVKKSTSMSTPVSEVDKIRASNNARALGEAALEQCVEYLNADDCCGARGFGSDPKFVCIGKDGL